MKLLREKLQASPTAARVVPFGIFLLLTFCQGQFGEASPYWFYLAKTIVGAWLIWEIRPFVTEMRWALSWEAIVVGVGVCVMWVGLDGHYAPVGELLRAIVNPVVKAIGLESWSLKPAATAVWNPHAR